MTAIELLNLALLKIGVSQGIAALDEASREAYTGALVFDHRLRKTLRAFPWPFATKYADLYLTRGPFWDADPSVLILVQAWSASQAYLAGDVVRVASINYYCILAHTNFTPVNATYWSTAEADAPAYANGDWKYAYRQPTDCLFARRLVDDAVGRAFAPLPIEFRKGADTTGLLLFTDREDANLEYTFIDCDALWADDLFIEAFTWDLAAALAPSLSRNKVTAEECLKFFLLTLDHAAAVAMKEGQQHQSPGDPDWIRNR